MHLQGSVRQHAVMKEHRPFRVGEEDESERERQNKILCARVNEKQEEKRR